VNTVEEYDPATDSWTFKKPMPVPGANFYVAVYENKIYCMGLTSSNDSGANLVFDTSMDMWEIKASMPSGFQWDLQVNVVNGKIYLMDEDGTLNEVYDPSTDTWSNRTPLPIENAPYVSAVVDDKIYFVGRNRIQVYDAKNDAWSQINVRALMNHPYTKAVATTGWIAPKRIYALGLVKGAYSDRFLYENNVQVYNLENNSWTSGNNLPSERLDFGAAVLNDKIYVVGGLASTSSGDFVNIWYNRSSLNEEYTPAGYGEQSSTPQAATPSPSPSPMPSPSPTPTPVLTPSPSPTPNVTPSPSVPPTIQPTQSPEISATSIASTELFLITVAVIIIVVSLIVLAIGKHYKP